MRLASLSPIVFIACARAPQVVAPPPPVATALPAPPPVAVEEDTSEARVVALYERGCNEGSGEGCNQVGLAYADGKHGVKVDRTLAITYFDRACQAKHGWGCVNLGVMLTEENATRARKILETGCTLGTGRGCTLASALALKANDDAAAFDLAKRGCDSGTDAEGCAVLGQLYHDGRGVPKDVARSVTLYGRACNAQLPAGCFLVGRALMDGDGVAKDPSRGIEFFTRGCDMGNATACNDLGVAYSDGNGVAVDLKRARGLLEKACNMHEAIACTNLARVIEQHK